MTIRDPRCAEGDCSFPNCPCEHPPYNVASISPDDWIIPMIVIGAVLALPINVLIFYLVIVF